MEEPVHIDEKPLRHSLDYYYLRAEGIKFIRQLSGALWTDFSEHDPGVTILEQLCFALTDLSYRTDFEIQNYFYNKRKSSSSFHKQEELLSCSAVSMNDYRKIMLDTVAGLNNSWVSPLPGRKSAINGLYEIIFEINGTINTVREKKEIIQKIKKVYLENRNFCEDFEEVKIANVLPVSFHADVEINEAKNAESIMAQIYFNINNYINPEIYFYSEEELLKENYSSDSIFDGPLLQKGFIKNENLFVKPTHILISELIKIIIQIEGIVGVKNSYFKIEDKIYKNKIEIGDHELLRFVNTFDESNSSVLRFYSDSLDCLTINYVLVKTKLYELMASVKKPTCFKKELLPDSQNDLMALEEYFSIQNDFPLVYGIGEYGISSNSDNARKGQVKQLKGYLLLFEQIMADYLSQLANIKALFSLNSETRQTYFYQSLENSVPGIKALFKKGVYQERLLKLSQIGNVDLDRRNRFLDYMLALHGVIFNQDLLIQFNYYYDKTEYEILLLDTKTKLLQSILSFTKNRARAYNYQKPKSTVNIAGIEERIYLLLGIVPFSFEKKSNNESYSSINSFNRIGLKLVETDIEHLHSWVWEDEEEVNNNLSDELYIKKNYCFVDTDDFLIGDYSDIDKDRLLAQLLFFRTGIISEEFLREGLAIEQYNIGEINGSWNIIFNYLRQEKWVKIGVCTSEKEANISVQLLINFLKNKNSEAEQFYILEHILLRPDRNECYYGIFILSPEGKALLRSTRLYTLEEREKGIKELEFSISCYENYTVEINSAGDFEMHFKTPDGEYSFISITAKESVEEMHSDMEDLFQYMSDQSQLISYENKIGLFVRYFQNAEIIPEDFFSFRSTILLPDWTARFNNKEFRAVAESVIIENMPAHVSSTIRWLNLNDMQEYEKMYHLWMEEKLKDIPDKEKLNQLNNFLVSFLLKLDRK